VRSAKAVKITDMDLIKRLGVILGIFVLFLLVRTLVSPPEGKSYPRITNNIGDKYLFSQIIFRKHTV
jgi:hypothetical protein